LLSPSFVVRPCMHPSVVRSPFYTETVRITEPKLGTHVRGYGAPIKFEFFFAPIYGGATTVPDVKNSEPILRREGKGYRAETWYTCSGL